MRRGRGPEDGNGRTMVIEGVGSVRFERSRRARRISVTIRASRGVRVAFPGRVSFDDARRLAELHRAVEDSCQSFGFAPEGRPLSPHLTLARIKEGERQCGQALAKSGVMDRALSLGSLPVQSVALMKSELRPTGPVYMKLWEVGLSGG